MKKRELFTVVAMPMTDVELLQAENERLRAEIDALATVLVAEWKRVAAARSEAEDENERLRAEVREAREFRDKLVKAIGNEQLRAFIEKHGEPVPLTNRVQAAEAENERLRADVAEWKRVAAAQAELHGEAEDRAERLAEALELARRTLAMSAIEGEVTRRIDSALAAHRKQGGGA